MNKPKTLVFLGAGHIASTLIEGIIKQGYSRDHIIISRRNKPELERQAYKWQVRPAANNLAAVQQGDIILLCVQPKQVKDLLAEVQSELDTRRHLVISLVAGLHMKVLQSALSVPIIRFMPNIAGRIGNGVTAMLSSTDVHPQDLDAAKSLASSLGVVVHAADDEQMDTYTSLCGSGLAYVFYFFASLAKSGELLGLKPEESSVAAFHTVQGAVRLIEQEKRQPNSYLAEIQVPHGTTEAAMKVLTAGGFEQALIAAAKAAKERSKELGKEMTSSLESLSL